MPSHIAFLRAVNVGKRQVKMASLRQWLTDDGFTDVQTYIQTGNVKVGSTMRSSAKVEQRIEQVLRHHAGFDVPCVMFTPPQLREVHADALALPEPTWVDDSSRRYATLFKHPLTKAASDLVNGFEAEREQVWVRGRAVHLWIGTPMMDAVVFGSLAKVLEPGTNRNLTVITALAQRWG